MNRSRFREEQIIGIVKEHHAGLGAKELCRKHDISHATFCKGRSRYGGMEVSVSLSDGRRFRVPCVIDDFGRECQATVVDTSLSDIGVARELDRIVGARGRPCMVVSDNATELTSNAILSRQSHSPRP